jgi:phosphoglucosamine mutase
MSHPQLHDEIARQQELLAGEGRVLVRPSGTEPIIRVLVEAKTQELAIETAEHLIQVIKSL